MTIDLDSAREARKREANKEPVTVTLGGKTFNLPVELPFHTVDLLVSMGSRPPSEMGGVFKDILLSLLGADQYEKFMELEPTLPDIMEMVNEMMAEYGMASGESPASPES